MTALTIPTRHDSATAAWSRRVRRIGGFIQAGFAGFWLLRGSAALGGTPGTALAIACVAVAAVVVAYGITATAHQAPRPDGSDARRIERAITIATVIQFAASFAAPAAVIAAGHDDWVLPSIAITIGPLLLWLDNRLDIPRYRPVGWTLVAGPVALVAVLSGSALAATTGLAAGTLLLATAAVGFHELAPSRN
ncbi:MAG: hypothetical protein JWO37_1184 [Acidimicrobiales bacterium]|jgi:hypothetical protein|nr:hypothetical protein [Acidimicrobiales bacterium]